ncbi:MAG: prephenate dehydrogenase/arogenate dehydrogenase family protein [Sedimentisphaerales bacterium]|nr:prephenate dehydrogenase/arogenate dehydrogenase family protein [Sedimentisphaerales bacterium]
MKDLRQVTVLGMGLLGASVTLAVMRSISRIRAVGYSHRASTRKKAEDLGVAHEISNGLAESVQNADLVILATPLSTFEDVFQEIAQHLKPGCIVTDVGSTKVHPHHWAEAHLPKTARYVGSHPITGSEKRGIEFARDDLLTGARCVLTRKASTDENALQTVQAFWETLGCMVHIMGPAEHDRTLGYVSHLPHVLAVALVNASDPGRLQFAGKGFIDTSRIASGPSNIWTDILATNSDNVVRGIHRVVKELLRLQTAIRGGNRKQVEKLLEQARARRAELIDYKIRNKELL